MLFKITPQLGAQIKHYASFPQTGVSLRQMVDFGRTPSRGKILSASHFLHNELPIRLARRVAELESMPNGLSEMPSVLKVKHWYAESFQELVDFPRLGIGSDLLNKLRETNRYHRTMSEEEESALPSATDDYNHNFTHLLQMIKKRHDAVVTTLANGILELKQKRGNGVIFDTETQSFLDRFYMSRIGIRVLIGQHIALQKHDNPPDYVGIVCTRTNICEVAEDAIANARFICQDHYGLFEAPEVKMYCAEDLEFMYLPSHLHHMLFELLKNSLRAVVETKGVDASSYPPIKVIVAKGHEDITIKVSDEGGGIPRSGIPMVWTYMYTTAKTPVLDPNFNSSDFKSPMAGFGYGLPLSRLYARYFGGDLRLISMEGYGTDAYLHLVRLSDSEEPLH